MAPYLLLFLLFQTVTCIEFIETSPVVVLDPRAALRAATISANPFHETTPNDFTDVIHDAIHLSEIILIFIEDTFSVEDISSRDSHGTPFKNIHANFLEEKAKYLPSVVRPYKTLKRLLPPLESNVVYIRDTIKPLDKNFKYHYLYFSEPSLPSETRVQRLRRHDVLISQAYNHLSTEHTGPVLVFYTGKSNPMLYIGRSTYKRPALSESSDTVMMATDKALIRLSANSMLTIGHSTYRRSALRESSDTVMMATDEALIRLSGVMLQQGERRTRLANPSMSARSFALRRLSTRMLYHDDIELDFNFEYLQDSWQLDSVVLLEGGEEVGRTTMGVGAPYDWSYFCSEPLIIVNTRDKSYVTISKYQVEPLRPTRILVSQVDSKTPTTTTTKAGLVPPVPSPGVHTTAPGETSSDKSSFTNTQSCGTNFNCRILAGLFVASIVVGISLGGVLILFDCRSNNRMDDPNQKPLVIMAQL